MAWTLYLLVGITVATASAHKCKQPPSYSNPVEDPQRQYQSQGPSGQNNDNYKIVFPGPTSEEFRLEIPENCKKLGFCEDVPNYPRELAKKVIAELTNKGLFDKYKLDLPDILPDITQRMGPPEDNIELCNLTRRVAYPDAAIDVEGQWYHVLQDDQFQGFKIEICEGDSSPCSKIVSFQPGYEARCLQKHVYFKMAVLHNGTYLEKSLQVPSCCSCVAKYS